MLGLESRIAGLRSRVSGVFRNHPVAYARLRGALSRCRRFIQEHRANAEEAASDGPGPLTRAFVWETLRTDQSERCIRHPNRDIVFDGFLIPQHKIGRAHV